MAYGRLMAKKGATRTKVKSTKFDVGKLFGHFQDPERSLI